MADLPPSAFLSEQKSTEIVRFGSLRDIRKMLEVVVLNVLNGALDYRVANTSIMGATQAARTFALESEIAERERKATSQLSDEDLEEALRQWRRKLIGEAHSSLVNGPRSDTEQPS